MNSDASGTRSYNPSRDIAIYELLKPMKGFEGIPFSLEPLTPGDEVEIAAFPGRITGLTDFSRDLTIWHGSFINEDQNGCLAFRYTLSETGGKIRPGSSGGIVVRNGKIVGILRAVTREGLIAEAVPVSSLEVFLSKVNPFLHAQLFPQATVVSPVSVDAFPPWDAPASPPGELERRVAEPVEVQAVRAEAQALYESMKYLMTRQTFAWSEGGTPQMQAAYDLKVRDGLELFTIGNHEYTEIPYPPIDSFFVPSPLWLNAPRYATRDWSLHIRHAGRTTINEKSIDVYQWQALGRESKICEWEDRLSFLLFERRKIYDVSCYGEVWLSDDGDIMRISETYVMPQTHFAIYEAVVVYGRVVLDGESHLVPTTISAHARLGKSRMLYCDSIFSDYRLWGSQVRLVPGP
jgi:hypothetical protein